MSEEIYIVSAARTPIGAFLGGLSSVSAPDLGATAIKGALEKAGLKGEDIDEVIMGCVLPAGQGQAPARQAMIKAGVPNSTGATTINKVCGSGMKAVMMAAAQIRSGEANIVVAGGMESMSRVPYYLQDARGGHRMGHKQTLDGMIFDGLWDPYDDMHMGNAGEICADKYAFTREEQDAFSVESTNRAIAASDGGKFKAEIVPVEVPQRKGDPIVIDTDEGPANAKPDKILKLKPAFKRDGGTITAGNASSINDGAAALVVASAAAVEKHGLKPIAKITGSTTHSQEPVWFTTAPVGAMEKLFEKTKLKAEDVDLYEINEAFAVVSMAAIRDLHLDHDKVNVRGGAIALGHPIGCTGARIIVTLLHALKDEGGKTGVASLCIGGGEATAMAFELV